MRQWWAIFSVRHTVNDDYKYVDNKEAPEPPIATRLAMRLDYYTLTPLVLGFKTYQLD